MLEAIWDAIVIVVMVGWGIIRRLFKLPKRVAGPAVTVAVIAAGLAACMVVFGGLLVSYGIHHYGPEDTPWVLYIGLIISGLATIFIKSFVGLCEWLAEPIMALFGWILNPLGIRLTQVDLSVQEGLRDLSMAFAMCSVFALDGREVGLSLPAICWASLATLVLVVILSNAEVGIRRQLMIGFAALFVLPLVLFDLSPATKQVAGALVNRGQFEQLQSADGIEPTTPVEALNIYRSVEQQAVANEMKRYQKDVSNFLAISLVRTPTQYEIGSYRSALTKLSNLSSRLRFNQPATESWAGWHWGMSVGVVLALFGFIAVIVIILIIALSVKVKARNRNKENNNKGEAEAIGNSNDGGHRHSGGSFNWKGFGITLAVIAALILLTVIAFKVVTPPALASVPPPVIIRQAVVPAPMPAPQKATGIVVNDPRYATTPLRVFKTLVSDPVSGEYKFELNASIIQTLVVDGLPLLPVAGATWKFSFSDTLVCPWGFPCKDAAGWTDLIRRPGDLVGEERVKYNADDFLSQRAKQAEAFANTGDGNVLELGNTYSWTVPSAADGKAVSVGFNIRRSEAPLAHGGGVLTLNTK